jgi:ATP-dependent helicase/nuclease subunit A
VIVERGAKPSHRVHTATEWALATREVAGAHDVAVVDARWKGERPAGPRFGTLVHALLATVDFDAGRERVAAHSEIHARLFGATEKERDAAVGVVVAALEHPLLRRAAASAREGKCRRESTITVRLEDGTMLEGVADLAFREDDAWIVVDFKTDAELKGREEVYRRQVAHYVRGIAEATASPGRGHLMLI